jgi:hypothetical protein
MKILTILLGLCGLLFISTGCESERHEHRGGSYDHNGYGNYGNGYGGYDRGYGSGYDRDYDRDHDGR